MTAKVEFSTIRYEMVHGRKPRGYGLWYFLIPGGVTFSHQGTYPQAKQAAATYTQRICVVTVARVQVCG